MQSTDSIEHDEPTPETDLGPIEAPRVKAPMLPQFGQYCCYPIGEPRTLEFRYCTAPVAQRGHPTAWSICVSAM